MRLSIVIATAALLFGAAVFASPAEPPPPPPRHKTMTIRSYEGEPWKEPVDPSKDQDGQMYPIDPALRPHPARPPAITDYSQNYSCWTMWDSPPAISIVAARHHLLHNAPLWCGSQEKNCVSRSIFTDALTPGADVVVCGDRQIACLHVATIVQTLIDVCSHITGDTRLWLMSGSHWFTHGYGLDSFVFVGLAQPGKHSPGNN